MTVINTLTQIGKVECHITAGYREFENLVHIAYGHLGKQFAEFQLAVEDELSNDTCQTYDVQGVLADYEREDFHSGNLKFGGNMLLNKLCEDGYIVPGEYLIKVSW